MVSCWGLRMKKLFLWLLREIDSTTLKDSMKSQSKNVMLWQLSSSLLKKKNSTWSLFQMSEPCFLRKLVRKTEKWLKKSLSSVKETETLRRQSKTYWANNLLHRSKGNEHSEQKMYCWKTNFASWRLSRAETMSCSKVARNSKKRSIWKKKSICLPWSTSKSSFPRQNPTPINNPLRKAWCLITVTPSSYPTSQVLTNPSKK